MSSHNIRPTTLFAYFFKDFVLKFLVQFLALSSRPALKIAFHVVHGKTSPIGPPRAYVINIF